MYVVSCLDYFHFPSSDLRWSNMWFLHDLLLKYNQSLLIDWCEMLAFQFHNYIWGVIDELFSKSCYYVHSNFCMNLNIDNFHFSLLILKTCNLYECCISTVFANFPFLLLSVSREILHLKFWPSHHYTT